MFESNNVFTINEALDMKHRKCQNISMLERIKIKSRRVFLEFIRFQFSNLGYVCNHIISLKSNLTLWQVYQIIQVVKKKFPALFLKIFACVWLMWMFTNSNYTLKDVSS